MTENSIGVAVIGVGMVGRAHAAGYRTAGSLFSVDRPDTRLVAIADAYEPFAVDAAKRFGYERAETSWEAIVDAPDVDVVSVAVANSMHREVVEALLGAGKHVLCEKPLAPSVEDAKAMVAAAEAATTHAGIGFTFRRAPGINAIREQVMQGSIGETRHFNGHYWCNYAQDASNPISWRYRGGPGSGALADIGSHMIDIGEFICGPMTSVSGAIFQTFTPERPVPVGMTVGHAGGEVSDEMEAVDNEDIATFTARFANGSVGTFSISRVAPGHANSLAFDLFAETGAAKWDMDRPAEFSVIRQLRDDGLDGYNQVLVGPAHPYLKGGVPMDFPGVSFGVGDLFGFQLRAFLEQVAGIEGGLPPVATFQDGARDLTIIDAVIRSAAAGGAVVDLPPHHAA